MTDMKRSEDKFTKDWQEAFDGAERQPPGQLWTRIESDLAGQQVGRYRKRILIYKLLVAATVVFAIGIGLFSWYAGRWPEFSSGEVVKNQERSIDGRDKDAGNQFKHAPALTDQKDLQAEPGKESGEEKRKMASYSDSKQKTADQPDGTGESAGMLVKDNYTKERNMISLPFLTGKKTGLNTTAWIEIKAPEKKMNLYEPFDEMIPVTDEFDDSGEGKLWAGVSLASGVFDPNISYGARPVLFGGSMDQSSYAEESNISPNANLSRSAPPEQTGFNPEFSYSYGLNMGYGLSERFVLTGGISYLYNATSTTVNSYIESTGTNRKFANQIIFANSVDLEGVSSYNTASQEIPLNNVYEFVSIPVNVGYYLINKDVQWMIRTGIATDLLIKNTIYDPDGYLESAELTSSKDSPYHSTYFNGIFGTSIHYTLDDRYLLQLAPAYRVGLSYLTKEGAGFNSRPSAFYVSAGISYIIK